MDSLHGKRHRRFVIKSPARQRLQAAFCVHQFSPARCKPSCSAHWTVLRVLPYRVCKLSRAAIRSSSAQTSAIRPAITSLPVPASDMRRNTRADWCVRPSAEESDAKKASLLPMDEWGRKDRLLWDADGPAGACGAAAGGLTLKGQFPRRGRLPVGDGDAGPPAAVPDPADAPGWRGLVWPCDVCDGGFDGDCTVTLPEGFSASKKRFCCSQRESARSGAGKVERVDKAIPM